MNKATISVVAMAAIAVPAQMQAEELTDEQKADLIAKKKASIDELRILLNAAANRIESGCPDVKQEYLTALSGITADMNKIYNDDTDLDISEGEINSFKNRIEDTEKKAHNAQKPYTAKAELDDAYKGLTETYNNAHTTASDKTSYPNVSDNKVKDLEAIYNEAGTGVKAIGDKIAAYDLKEQTIVNEKGRLLEDIKAAGKKIEELVNSIAKDEAATASNEDAHNAVVNAYNSAKEDYNTQLKRVISALPTPVYEDWQNDAIAALNAQYRIINEARNADEALYGEGKSATANGKHKDAITTAQAEINSIVNKYVADKDTQEAAKTAADADVKTLQDALDNIKNALAKYNLTDCDADIKAVQEKINALTADIKAKYEEHAIAGYDYEAQKTTIADETGKIDDNAGHGYKSVLANHEAMLSMEASIKEVQAALNDAKKKATETLSDDKNYNAGAYFTTTLNNIQKQIDDLGTAVDKAYSEKKAVTYHNDTFPGKRSAISTKTSEYSLQTAAALKAYNTAKKKAADADKLLKVLKETAKDTQVTVDGSVNGETYGSKITKTEGEIKAINDKVTSALAKKDKEHQTEMEAAANLQVSEDIQALTDNYNDMKDRYDTQSAIKAAEAIIKVATDNIQNFDKELEALVPGEEHGNQKEIISNKKEELIKRLDKVKEDYAQAKNDYDNAADEDKKNAAANVIASLSEVNTEIGKIKEDLEKLIQDAEKAKANKTANDEITNSLTEAQTFVDKVRDETVMTVATGSAQTFYLNQITKSVQSLTTLGGEVDKAYAEIKSDEKKADLLDRIDKIKEAAKKLQAEVLPNENAHNDQVSAAGDLQTSWNTTYDKISQNDLSEMAAGYLQRLAKLQEDINKLNDSTIPEAFAKGESVKQKEAIDAETKKIADEIIRIASESEDNYNDNVFATNKAAHDLFLATYTTANKTFSDAVGALNDFSNIKNAALKEAMENLTETHDRIYAYADLLRNLKSDENADYIKYTGEVTYGQEGIIYSADEWIKKANQYNEEIDKNLKEYQDIVNQAAKKAYENDLDNAETKLGTYKKKVEGFVCDGADKAFKDVEDVIEAAKAAGAIDEDGTIKDRYYAVKVDKWLETIGNNAITGKLDADLATICEKEKAKRVGDATALYNKEKDEIAGFGDIDNAGYLGKLARLKETTIDVAADTEATYNNVTGTIIPLCNKYYGTDDKKDHSDIYTEAYNNSVAGKKNLEMYSKLSIKATATGNDFTEVKTEVEKLIVGHIGGVTKAKLDEIEGLIQAQRNALETWKENGQCVANETAFNTATDNIVKKIAELKDMAITNEAVQLAFRVDKVKEEYNQVAKEDLDKVKEYDEKIEALYSAVADIKDKYTSTDNKVKIDFKTAVGRFAEQEAAIAQIYKELNDMYENAQNAEAIASIDESIAGIEKTLAQAETWADYNTATRKYAQAILNALRGEFGLIQADYAEKNNAGKLLFYKDNILFDLKNLQNDADVYGKDGSELNKLYDKHVTNDNVNTSLTAELNKYSEDLQTAYDKVKDFKHKDYVWVSGSYGSWKIDYVKSRIENAIADYSEDVKNAYEAVELVTDGTLNKAISEIAGEITTLEREAKVYEANGDLNDLQSDANRARNLMYDGKHNYGGDRGTTLETEYGRISRVRSNASSYNDDAQDGYIWNDIDNNPIGRLVNGEWVYGESIDYWKSHATLTLLATQDLPPLATI